jgi:two-component system cell cycle sensor histidine kinase/response regulator CckA
MNLDIAADYLREHAWVRAGQYVVLAVSDTGHGMDAETKARLFEPFFTTKEVGKGTGLGLATVYGMVKQSGGYVWCYTEPGRGTCFKVYLPRVEEMADAVRRRDAVWTGKTHGTETILVVEDEEPVRQLVSNVLETRGYTVLRASDGEQALMLSGYHAGPIHLVVSDIVMPGMTGPEMVDRIAADRPGVKALFMSGYTDGTVAHHGFLAEDAAYLEKPFGLDKLTAKVREVLGD